MRHGSTKRSLLALLLALTMLALTAPARAETWGDWEFEVDSKGTAAITAYKGGGGDVQIPSRVTASGGVSYPVQSIGDNAFLECEDLRSVTIPDSVQSIGSSAFSDCASLQSVTIPDSVQSIGGGAFQECTGLQSVTIPDSVQSIGISAFSDCTGLRSATIADGVQEIGSLAFAGCTGLRSATIPGSVQSIGERAFLKCTSLQSLTIPGSVESIGPYAFAGCTSLTDIHFDGTEAGWQAVSKGDAAIPTGVTVHHDGWLVRLDANGGSVSPTSIRAGDDGKVSPLPAPTRTGHTFKGWFDAPSGGRQVMDSTVITSFPTTLWAIWEVGVPATGIALDKASLDLAVGSADVLTATLVPAEATDAIVWASTDPSVATVADGTVTGMAPGATAITATAGGQMAVCVVTVRGDGGPDPGPAIASVTLDRTALSLAVGSADVLTATTDPAGATVAWASTHPGVATVTGGTVMGVGPGLAIVTATAGGQMAVCVVTVRGDGGRPVPMPSPTEAQVVSGGDSGAHLVLRVESNGVPMAWASLRAWLELLSLRAGGVHASAAPGDVFGPFVAVTDGSGLMTLDVDALVWADGPDRGREGSIPAGAYRIRLADADGTYAESMTGPTVALAATRGDGEGRPNETSGGGGCSTGLGALALMALEAVALSRQKGS